MTHPGLLVANLAASRLAEPRRRAMLLRLAGDALAARTGYPPEVVVSREPAARAAREADAPIVAAIGGDGTFRLAAWELAGSSIPLGLVPAGTGNLLAAALGISRSPERAATALETFAPRVIDAGHVDEPACLEAGGLMLVACGVGFDAAVMAATSPAEKRRFGLLAYFGAAARLVPSLRALTFRIRVDGVSLETAGLLALVANCGQLVPGVRAPRIPIDPADGLLELLVVRGGVVGGTIGGLELLAHRPPHEAGLPRGRSLRIRGRRIEIETDPPAMLQVDGDPLPPSRLVVEVRPGAFHVLAPV